jgi:hypothetical protein
MKTFDIMEALAEPFRQAGRRPMATIVWGLVGLLPTVILFALVFSVMGHGALIEAVETQGDFGPEFGLLVNAWANLAQVLDLIVGAVVIAAVTRATFAVRRKDAAFFLRLGWDEFRVAVIYLLIVVLAVVALALIMLIAVAVGASVWSLLSPPSRMLFFTAMIIGLVLVSLWFAGRASLLIPTAILHRRLAIEEGWKMGRGQSWRLVGLLIMLFIVMLAVALVMMLVAVLVALAVGALVGGMDWTMLEDPEDWAMDVGSDPWIWGPVAALILIPVAWVQGFFQLLGSAPFAHVVRELSTAADSTPETTADNPDESV